LTLPSSQSVRIGDDSELQAPGQGTVPLSVFVSGKTETLQLRNVLHVPDIAMNLLSASKLSAYGELTFTDRGCRLKRKNMNAALLMTSSRASKREPPPIDLDLAHRRLGHLNAKAIDILARGDIAKGLILKSPTPPSGTSDCEPCRRSPWLGPCGSSWTDQTSNDRW